MNTYTIHYYLTKTILTILLSFVALSAFGQLVDYQIRVKSISWQDCTVAGEGYDNYSYEEKEYLANILYNDNVGNNNDTDEKCYRCNTLGDVGCSNTENKIIATNNASCASTINLGLRTWESDNLGADICDMNNDAGAYNDNDCKCPLNSTAINFKNDPTGQWNDYTISCGTSNAIIQIKWNYVDVCKNISINLNSSGSATITPQDVSNTSSCLNLISVSPNTFDCSNIGTNNVTLSYNDGNGGATQTCTAVVTVNAPSSNVGTINTTPIFRCTPYNPPRINGSAGGGYQWQLSLDGGTWTNINGATGRRYNPPNITTSGIYSYRRCRTGANNPCGGPACTEAKVITVSDKPSTPTATPSPAEGTVCTGETITLTNIVDNGGGTGNCFIEYRYIIATGLFGDWTNWSTSVPSISASGEEIEVQMRKRCPSNPSGCRTSTTVSYVWNVSSSTAPTAPTITITETSGSTNNDGQLCYGDAATLNAGSGYSSYQWSNSQTTQSISATTAGDYTVTVTNAAGCTASATVSISVNSQITAGTCHTDDLCQENIGQITVQVSGGVPPYTFGYTPLPLNLSETNNGTEYVLNNIPGGSTIQVSVTDSKGCSP